MLHRNTRVHMAELQSAGWFFRLQRELTEAYTAPVCDNGLIERLTDELARLRRGLRHDPGVDEQSSDTTVPGVVPG
ncbi:MAG: hypothetical protein M3Z29_08960 [Pseudomonadota bacterium]|nr:hypothetical protein [Pseudomonadota bacterium]